MYHSYVLGADDSIYSLCEHGFIIEKEWDNYKVSFPNDKANEWEIYIYSHLNKGYWNDYITDGGVVVFLFNLDGVIKRYEVYFYQNDDVLHLCEQLCECKFESIYSMLKSNHFYSEFI